MMKISTVFVWLAALISLVMGTLYLIWPIAPYHQNTIKMTAQELALNYPNINALMTTQINVIGLSLLGVGVLTVYVGMKIWQDKTAWVFLLISTFVFTIPLIFTVEQTLVKIIIAIPTLFQGVGLILAATVDKSWGK